MTLRRSTHRLARILLLGLILLTIVGVAICARRERLIDTWKPINYNVNIHLNEDLTEVTSAKTEVSLLILKDNVTAIDFDFGTMPITAVTLNGEVVPYERADGRLNVKPVRALARNSRVVVSVSYHGKPADGL